MRSTLALPGEVVLTHQNEDRQEDGLERYDQREEAEGERVDGAPAGHEPRVPRDPPREPENMEPRDPGAPGDSRDGVREALGRGPTRPLGGLDLGDRRRVSRHQGRRCRVAGRRFVKEESHEMRRRRPTEEPACARLSRHAPAARQRGIPSFSRVWSSSRPLSVSFWSFWNALRDRPRVHAFGLKGLLDGLDLLGAGAAVHARCGVLAGGLVTIWPTRILLSKAHASMELGRAPRSRSAGVAIALRKALVAGRVLRRNPRSHQPRGPGNFRVPGAGAGGGPVTSRMSRSLRASRANKAERAPVPSA